MTTGVDELGAGPILHAWSVPDERPPETQEQRALRALQEVYGGADLTAEAEQLANEFTDRQTGRLSHWLKSLFGRGTS